jgi:putative peptidoglycan lipid II flippase
MPALGLPPIAGIAIATLIGGLGQIAVQWPLLRKEGFRYQPVIDFKDPELRQILRLMGPGTLGVAAVQINVFVNTILATSQQEGAVSWLSFAFRLMYLPIGLFGVSIATASLPEISRHAAVADRDAMRRTIASGLRLMLMLNVPAMIGLIALAGPIVSFLLERGRFTPADTAATAAALTFYAPGLLGYSAVKIASPSFYSLGDARTPVAISVVTVVANLVLNLVLAEVMGFRGLALGTALAAVLNAGALLLLLDRRLDGLETKRTAVAFVKILAASVAMGAVAWWTADRLESVLPAGRAIVMSIDVFTGARLLGGILAGLAVLGAAARLLRIEEFDEAFTRVLRRLGRR